jgi:hypothetical protein
MKMYFTLYSEALKQHTDFLVEAIRCKALMENERGELELVISKVSDKLIDLFVREYIACLEPEEYDEKLPPLDGGLRIEEAGAVIEHQCCSELDDYLAWAEILKVRAAHWTEIWIGHPWIYYRIEGPSIYLTDYCEDLPDNMDYKFVFDKEIFFAKLRGQLISLYEFGYKLRRYVQQGDFQKKEVLLGKLLTL